MIVRVQRERIARREFVSTAQSSVRTLGLRPIE